LKVTHSVELLATKRGGFDERAESSRPLLGGLEYRFGLLLAFFGLLFVFTLPPVQVSDENAHFLHAFDVAQGHLLPAHDEEGWGGTIVPVNLMPVIDKPAIRLWGHPEARWTWQDFQELLDLRFTEAQRSVSIAQVSIYSFVPYLPQAAGICLARWLDLPPLPLFYAGRLANLAFAILCVVLTIRLAPVGKLLFGAIALLPLTVQQFASVSADAPAIGLTLVLVASLLRLTLSPQASRQSAFAVSLLLMLIFALAMTKFPYTVLVLLYFGMRPHQAGSRRYWLTGSLILAVAVAGLATSYTLTRPYILDPHRILGQPISKSAQIHFILTHPLRYVWICLSNMAEHGHGWVMSLFILGCLDTPLNPLANMACLIFLSVLALADRGRPSALPWRLWLVGAAVTVLSAALTLTALYVWWNPLASRFIDGPQGRYVIPLLPVFFLLLRNGGVHVTADPRFLARMTIGFVVIFLSYAWISLVNRYYFPQPPIPLSPPALLGLGVVAFLLLWARCRWSLARKAPDAAASPALDATTPVERAA
jgi:uncharacterized membrane protein